MATFGQKVNQCRYYDTFIAVNELNSLYFSLIAGIFALDRYAGDYASVRRPPPSGDMRRPTCSQKLAVSGAGDHRGAAARLSRSLIASPSPARGTGMTAMVAAPQASSA